MTNAEAIQELERQYLAITEYGNVTNEARAIDKAINALSAIEDIKWEIDLRATSRQNGKWLIAKDEVFDIIDKHIGKENESDK